MNYLVRVILLPFSLLYGLVVWIRNRFFDWGLFSITHPDVPLISVGNLSTGGTGKTPHVELLVHILKGHYHIGILSRGYRRKTSGYQLARPGCTALDIGDEPYQLYQRFSDDNVKVAVDENRVRGCRKLLDQFPQTDVIILDDAYQHRWIGRGLNILLTDFYHPYYKDSLLPGGRLRESKAEAKRANIIIVTKSGKVLSPITRRNIEKAINPLPHQRVCFSYIQYQKPKPLPCLKNKPQWGKTYAILMVTGIANPYPLEAVLTNECSELHHLKFSDHHQFSPKDAQKIKHTFQEIVTRNKIIITTEKDAMRLCTPEISEIIQDLPVFYWPIRVNLHTEDNSYYESKILDYVRKNPRVV